MQLHSDQDLLAAFAAGDQEAFAALMARHQELVRAACRRQAAPGDWDDCAQAVFLVLARRADSARRAPALEAWLLRTASYVCRASRRAQLRRQRAERAVQPTKDQPVPAVAGRCNLAGLGAQHLKRLDQPVSAEISGEAPVALVQAGRLVGLEVVFDPRIMVLESPRRVAFAARSLSGRDLLAWVCYLGGLQARVVQGRLFVEPAVAYGGF